MHKAAPAHRSTGLVVFGVTLSLIFTPAAGARFLLSDPGSEVYHRYVAVAGSTISVELESDLVGNLHCNGTIALKSDVHVAGDVTAVGSIVNLGSVSGTLIPGAPPVPLPALLDETAMRALADRVFEQSTVFTDAVVDDVVFVAGSATIQGSLDGVGTIFATGDVLLRVSAALPAAGSQISIVALGDVKLAANRRFRGALHAGHDVVFEPGVGFEGVIVASHKVLIKRASRPTFSSFDTMPPLITVTHPTDGATVTTGVLSVAGTALDASGVRAVSVAGLPAQLSGASFSASVSLAPGANLLTVSAVDGAGNTGSVSLTVTFETDTTPPQIAITSPQNGSFVLESRPMVGLRLSDDKALASGSLLLLANGTALAASCSEDSSGSFVCLPEQDLPEGPVQLGATVADVAGNLGSAVVDLVVDTEGLGVTITEPLPDTVTSADRVTVAGTTAASVASVSVNGVEAPISAGGFEVEVPLRDGVNTLVVLATKSNGRTGTASVQHIRDVFAPTVRIDSPRSGWVSVAGTVAVTGVVNDLVPGGAEARVTVNGVAAVVGNGAFLVEQVALDDGFNTLEAVAVDRAGNVGHHAIEVFYQPAIGAHVVAEGGGGQRGFVGTELAEPMVVLVRDELGQPLAGRQVRFEVVRNDGLLRTAAGGAPVRSVVVPSDGGGRAEVLLTLGTTAGVGTNRVRASALGAAGEVELCATGLAREPAQIVMTMGDNQRGVAAAPLPLPLEALVVDPEGNPVAEVPVTFTVVEGGGTLDGAGSTTVLTGLDGLARTVLTLGREPGINNQLVTATFEGNVNLPAGFTATAVLAADPAATAFSGVVLDNALTPIPDAVVSATAGEATVSTTTDAEGQFRLAGVPVGAIHLHVDPALSPRPETFPPLAFETVTIAGAENDLGRPILIPPLDVASTAVVGGPEDVTLAMAGVEGLTLTVLANSVTCPDGSRTCPVTLSQVHLDKIPMPPPGGSAGAVPAWTLQPHGVFFDPPARMTLPNPGLPPGWITTIYQFDHALNQFVDAGKGTVSEDGTVIVSDPGFGITHAGWGWGRVPQRPFACEEAPCRDRDPQDCKNVIGVDCGDCRVENEPDGKMCWVNKRHPGFCEAGRCNTCPTSVTIKGEPKKFPLERVFPGKKTGLGIIVAMEVHPSEINWIATEISEKLSLIDSDCDFIGECTGGPPFVVQLGGKELGEQLDPIRNVFYDMHLSRKDGSVLHLNGKPNCSTTCEQNYYCGGKVIGTFEITRLYEADTIDGVEVTRVTVTKK